MVVLLALLGVLVAEVAVEKPMAVAELGPDIVTIIKIFNADAGEYEVEDSDGYQFEVLGPANKPVGYSYPYFPSPAIL